MRYRKKPVIVNAFQLGKDEIPDWAACALEDYTLVIYPDKKATILTLEGKMTAQEGDYIIKGVAGEIYPCKEEIFNQTYEKVED
jgi:hypothetical protein